MASQYDTYYVDVFIPRNVELAVLCSLALFYKRNFKTRTILVENLKKGKCSFLILCINYSLVNY